MYYSTMVYVPYIHIHIQHTQIKIYTMAKGEKNLSTLLPLPFHVLMAICRWWIFNLNTFHLYVQSTYYGEYLSMCICVLYEIMVGYPASFASVHFGSLVQKIIIKWYERQQWLRPQSTKMPNAHTNTYTSDSNWIILVIFITNI